MVYLALYKGKGRWLDRLIRFVTKGQYSHCEIAVHKEHFTDRYSYEAWYECYSASPREGGVRIRIINVENIEKWDLIPLVGVSEVQIEGYFHQTKGKKYDFWGAMGLILGIKQKKNRFFCSEWCFNAIKKSDQGWRFSPNQLAEIVKAYAFGNEVKIERGQNGTSAKTFPSGACVKWEFTELAYRDLEGNTGQEKEEECCYK